MHTHKHINTHTLKEGIDELSFKEGDLIMLKTRVDDQWLRGKLLNGVEGIFPKSFVEIVVSGLDETLKFYFSSFVLHSMGSIGGCVLFVKCLEHIVIVLH